MYTQSLVGKFMHSKDEYINALYSCGPKESTNYLPKIIDILTEVNMFIESRPSFSPSLRKEFDEKISLLLFSIQKKDHIAVADMLIYEFPETIEKIGEC